MEHPSHAKAVFTFTMSIVVVIYVGIGAFGYLVYGADTRGSITLNLSGNSLGETM